MSFELIEELQSSSAAMYTDTVTEAGELSSVYRQCCCCCCL